MEQQYPSSTAVQSETDVIARAQRGDESAFEELFHTHKKRVYRLCLRMIGNAAEAEDLTQEAFLQVFRKIRTFRGESAFSTWLHRIAVNVVLMRLRKKTPKEIPAEWATRQSEKPERVEREFAVRDLELSGVVDRVSLELAVGKLSEGYREVFLLHDVLGYEHHEIATAMGFTIGNSKSQLHKARLRLRQILRSRLSIHSGRGDLTNILECEVYATE